VIRTVLFDLDDTLYAREDLVRQVVTEQYDDCLDELRAVPKQAFVDRVLLLDDHGYADRRALYAWLPTGVRNASSGSWTRSVLLRGST
jgi:FMN phosphatase YigB (HAD superfamily)